MTKRDKIIIAALSVLFLVFSVFMLTAASVNEANKRAVRDFREKTLQTFEENDGLYGEITERIKNSFAYDDVCIVFSDGGVFAKNDYSNININDGELRKELLSFAEKTDVDVIYYDGEQIFFKTAFSVGEMKTEANIIMRDDLKMPELEDCIKLSGDWYYAEFDVI